MILLILLMKLMRILKLKQIDILKHNRFLDICDIIGNFSHCISRKVGCIIVKDGRIIASGYNGTPAKFTNCDEIFTSLDDREAHHKFSEDFEVHAEINAVLMCAKHGVSIQDAVIYTNLQPCKNCLKMLCNSGIKKIYFRNRYDLSAYPKEMLDMLNKLNIELILVEEKKCYINGDFLISGNGI